MFQTSGLISVVVFFCVGVGMATVPILLSFLLWRNKGGNRGLNALKDLEPYESGMPAVGSGRAVGFEYFIYSILFLFFDIISIFLFLGAMTLRAGNRAAFFPVMFLMLLAVLLIAYGAKKRGYMTI